MESVVLTPTSWIPYVTFASGMLALVMAGWPYAFGVFSEDLKTQLQYTQTEVNLIPALGNSGMYCSGVLAGAALPVLGLFWNQIIAAGLMTGGQILIALTYSKQIPATQVEFMIVYVSLTGLGGVIGATGPIAAIALNSPPNRKGIIMGVLMAGYAMSPLVLSKASGLLFPGSALGFFIFGAIFAACSFGLSSLFVRRKKKIDDRTERLSDEPESRTPSRESSSSSSGPVVSVERGPVGSGEGREVQVNSSGGGEEGGAGPIVAVAGGDESSSQQKRVKGQWADVRTREYLLSLIIFGSLTGPGLMFIGSVSSMGKSLFGPVDEGNAKEWENYKDALVSTLSFSSFAGRILIGLASDYALHQYGFTRRACILVCICITGVAQCLPLVLIVKEALFVCAVCAGLQYGASFSLYSSYISDQFGSENFALNWGVMTTIAAWFGFAYGLVFGRVYDAQADAKGHCYGAGCYRGAFLATLGILIVLGVIPAALLMNEKIREGVWIGGVERRRVAVIRDAAEVRLVPGSGGRGGGTDVATKCESPTDCEKPIISGESVQHVKPSRRLLRKTGDGVESHSEAGSEDTL
uniref:Uncharacterized protein n=1 Tax=Chromera velia CCMP2878 TaxID=1169474 RepID=A0A0G4ICP0_9ALVE|eukprot:Cvel_2283.t1-p1 / transcript=Cvel_2283.t1 / gene=Cvel_2283 / organism=Chromera_velia_CCMP2878 / gene_product=Uncharacterized membrane protein YMR155W, putative / transcript_product=Uncharacterized membrane protein YMR155W, putative / location=Cvel_scaffold88:96973-99546(-) / protein_length=580 / sequence_SO=supercontig / SO=protein_coding / is_pseudo=false